MCSANVSRAFAHAMPAPTTMDAQARFQMHQVSDGHGIWIHAHPSSISLSTQEGGTWFCADHRVDGEIEPQIVEPWAIPAPIEPPAQGALL